MRLQKYIAQCGIASRRAAEKLILDGEISINGKIITELGTKVDPENDIIFFQGTPINPIKKKTYIILNKPQNHITTKNDTHDRPTVFDLLPEALQHLVPAGRLDKDTTGLLLLSNDGDFIYKITHPKFDLEKEYIVLAKGLLNQETIKQLEQGIIIENQKTYPAKISNIEHKTSSNTLFHITIHEGRKRQIRKMLEAVGHPVKKLRRIRIGHLKIEDLKTGKYRELSKQELNNFNL